MSGHDVKTGEMIVLADGEAIAQYMARWLTEQALAKTDGPFVVALSGGSTPKRLYEILGSADFATRFPWDRTQLFFGDERFVPATDPASNYTMTRTALLSHISIPPANVHPMPTEGDPAAAAARYQAELQAVYGADTLQPGRPLFDVVMLGLGDNGHTASLFPRQPVLQERRLWVSTCVPDDAPHTRLTLTYPAIHSSRHVVFMLAGAGKREAFAKVRAGDPAEPASHITTEGELVWLLDKAAAAV
ncbi:6-phosphogluconolactonase [Gluconacetobacter diazotrophicus PA1 5]|uniref:6-phosphogluconolactonase n=1 Tax=Gluconacetobacter diazotrophicus (strain ATCC 49037 / DSM 5601 / CCUG 37298 / CIP 103539 / LMG 7603 / PAl5) TaxID=272568 RepID=A9H335_GLUDA|nr:6-phosphogluconolactonase [Gluconacetobacter diazotrophicus]ACI52108.1 6-phosphogluconolactonase [Gluconacetobacter diazotrophicus PA1 5]TWB02817.1 6-phosphogluconolactonase [Gluconacetobacter diazotrophicus]CAP54234.1 6-phosphogluconolactonase [Gluconacetobacter diazotrophicus PA1 5]